MRIKNILISIVMVGLASYGGLKLYMWDKAKKDIDKVFAGITYGMKAGFALDVQANYERISTSIYGPVGIRGVKIRIPSIEEELTVDEFKLLERDFDVDLQKGNIPLRLHFQITGLKMTTSFMEKLDSSIRKIQKKNNIPAYDPQSVFVRLGYHELISRSGNLWDLGYDQVSMDLEFDMIIDPVTKEATFKYHQKIQDLGELSARVKVADMSGSLQNAVLGMRIKDATITFTDDTYIERFLQLYASEQNMDLEEYRKQLPTIIQEDFSAKKLKLSEESVKNILAFIQNPEKVIFTIYPYRPVGIESIKHYKPGDVPMLLNLQAHLE